MPVVHRRKSVSIHSQIVKARARRDFKLCRVAILPLVATFLCMMGCGTLHSDPLAGWKYWFKAHPDKAIVDDYQAYIAKLPPKEREFVGVILFYEDAAGRHAVKIEVDYYGTWREHLLIYDANNKRIKVIRYSDGHYHS